MDPRHYARKVFYYETDKMGIVHHANYIRMFEEARIHFLENLNWPYHRLEEMGLMMPVLHAECQYKVPLQFGDGFRIEMNICEMTGVRMTIAYQLYGNEGSKVYATGLTKHAFVDANMRPIRLQRRFPDVYKALQPDNKKDEEEKA